MGLLIVSTFREKICHSQSDRLQVHCHAGQNGFTKNDNFSIDPSHSAAQLQFHGVEKEAWLLQQQVQFHRGEKEAWSLRHQVQFHGGEKEAWSLQRQLKFLHCSAS